MYVLLGYDSDIVSELNPAVAGTSRHPPAAGGHIFAHIFFLEISLQRKGVEVRNLAHTYLHKRWKSDVVLKFGAITI